jgi:hypothetical protein
LKELLAAAIGGSVVAIISAATAYFINYERIERPKLLLDASKMTLELSPRVSIECKPEVQPITINLICVISNEGKYPLQIIEMISDYKNNSLPLVKYAERGDFWTRTSHTGKGKIIYPGGTRTTSTFIESSQGKSFLEPAPLLVQSQTAQVLLQVNVESIRSSSYFIRQAYPDSATALDELSKSELRITHTVSLKPPAVTSPNDKPKPLVLDIPPAVMREAGEVIGMAKSVSDQLQSIMSDQFKILP